MGPSTLVPTAAQPTTDRPTETSLIVPEGVRLIVDPEDLERLCLVPANRDLRLERESDGGLIVMAPAGMDGSRRNLTLAARLWNWNDATGLGAAFDSSSGMTFPNTAVRAPDAT